MGLFDPDENPDFIRMESQINNIKKILKSDFLSSEEKIFFIERIVNSKDMKGGFFYA